MSKLKATKPEPKDKRLKMFVFGQAGSGKTTAAIQFPNAYIIDTERGTDQYAKTIADNGSVVLQTNNFDEISEQVRALLTEKHEYRTLIIDPNTKIYESIQEKWTRIFEKYTDNKKASETQDFGMRYWQRVKSEYKALFRMISALDMNVIVTAHQKDVYGDDMKKSGVTFDSMKGDDYFFDFVFRLQGNGRGKRTAFNLKERSDLNQWRFPDSFEWSYDNFVKYYGKEILERESVAVVLATPEQVWEIKRLLDVVKVDEDWQTKIFNKANVDEWDELTSDQIKKCIDFLQEKLNASKGN